MQKQQRQFQVPARLLEAEYVYIRRGGTVPPLAPLYHGPYKVLAPGKKFFKVSLGGKPETVSVDRLKPHLGGPVVPADPPLRGRPPQKKFVAPASSFPESAAGGGPCGGL